MAFLEADRVACAYRGRRVLSGVSFSVDRGEVFGLLGPNGSGKTSLIRLMTRTHPLAEGELKIGGKRIEAFAALELARTIAAVPQTSSIDFPFTVHEMAALGRRPFQPRFGFESAEDLSVVERAMRMTGVWELRDRLFYELSGGEAQRAVIARCLSQQCGLLALDEPTSHLDIKHQAAIFRLLRRLAREEGMAVVVSTHDLNAAAQFCDRTAILKNGEIFAMGAPGDVVTEKNVAEVYETPVRVIRDPLSGAQAALFSRMDEDERTRRPAD